MHFDVHCLLFSFSIFLVKTQCAYLCLCLLGMVHRVCRLAGTAVEWAVVWHHPCPYSNRTSQGAAGASEPWCDKKYIRRNFCDVSDLMSSNNIHPDNIVIKYRCVSLKVVKRLCGTLNTNHQLNDVVLIWFWVEQYGISKSPLLLSWLSFYEFSTSS